MAGSTLASSNDTSMLDGESKTLGHEMNYAHQVVDRFQSLFQTLTADNSQGPLLDQVYQRNMVFQDSFHRIEGLPAFKDYCESVYENVTECGFNFHRRWVTEHDAMMTWTMSYRHPRLKKGRLIEFEGSSEIRFGLDGDNFKVFYHRDFFDGGQLLYEHVPLLGSVIQKLKQRMV